MIRRVAWQSLVPDMTTVPIPYHGSNPGIYYTVLGEIMYPSPNFNGASIEIWEWRSNSITHFTSHVITYGPLTRYVKLQIAHAPGMPGTFSPTADFIGNH